MSDTYEIKGGAKCVWGVGETVTQGTIIDATLEEELITDDCETQEGAVDGIVVYDRATKATLSVVAGSAATPPAVGTVLTITGATGTFLVESAGVAKRHKAKQMFNIVAVARPGVTVA